MKFKPATHCFIFNLSKQYLNNQVLGQWDDWLSDQAHYIEDCRILGDVLKDSLDVFEFKKALAPLCALGRLPNSTQTNLIFVSFQVHEFFAWSDDCNMKTMTL